MGKRHALPAMSPSVSFPLLLSADPLSLAQRPTIDNLRQVGVAFVSKRLGGKFDGLQQREGIGPAVNQLLLVTDFDRARLAFWRERRLILQVMNVLERTKCGAPGQLRELTTRGGKFKSPEVRSVLLDNLESP